MKLKKKIVELSYRLKKDMNKVEDEKIKEKIDVQNIIVLLKMKKKNLKKK